MKGHPHRQAGGVGPLGMLLRRARVGADMTLKEVAQCLGCSIMRVNHWEHFDCIPSRATVEQLAAIYGCDPERLVEQAADALAAVTRTMWLAGMGHLSCQRDGKRARSSHGWQVRIRHG